VPEEDTPTWPGPHYDTAREPAQHPPGETAPEPVSREAIPDATSLVMLLDRIEQARETERTPMLSPYYRRDLAELRRTRAVLEDLCAAEDAAPEWRIWLRVVRGTLERKR
jgi:hypothetical protein